MVKWLDLGHAEFELFRVAVRSKQQRGPHGMSHDEQRQPRAANRKPAEGKTTTDQSMVCPLESITQ
jgi:hypothetical protein